MGRYDGRKLICTALLNVYRMSEDNVPLYDSLIADHFKRQSIALAVDLICVAVCAETDFSLSAVVSGLLITTSALLRSRDLIPNIDDQ